MNLSADLLKDFADITLPQEDKRPESTVYGTVHYKENDTEPYVQIDGSDILTPVSYTEHVEEGDRVLVLLKNRRATITGNISTPVGDPDTMVRQLEYSFAKVEIVTRIEEKVESLDAKVATIDNLEATYAKIVDLEANYATLQNLDALNAEITALDAKYATITELNAAKATISQLQAGKADIRDLQSVQASIENLDATYATVDMLNVGEGAIKSAQIEGLSADKITAGTIDASNITVTNLNADNITTGTINGHRIAGGAIDASKLSQELNDTIDSAVADTTITYALSTSNETSPSSGWSTVAPEWEDGKYMWQRTTQTLVDGTVITKPPVCISGATGQAGAAGEDAVLLRIDSSRGNMFKNNQVSTTLTVTIFVGGDRITNLTQLQAKFGSGAYLQWYWQRMGDNSFGTILSTDPMISNDGFAMALTPDEVDVKVTFMCELIV